MSDSIAHKCWMVKETTYGVAVANPNLTYVRNTGFSVGLSREGFESEEARADRAVPDYRLGNKTVGGDINLEFSYGSFDMALEAVFCGTDWAVAHGVHANSDISAELDDQSLNDASNNLPLYALDEKVTVAGFTTPGNNGVFLVESSTAAKLILKALDGSAAGLVDEAAGDAVTITSNSSRIKTGATRRSFNLVRQFTDQIEANKPFYLLTGCMVNAFNLTVAPGGNIKGSFTVLGKDQSISGTGPAGATYGVPTTTRVFDSFTGALYENGTLMANVTEIQFKIENGFESQFVCFSDTTIDPSIGVSRVSGSIGVHFKNSVMLEKFINEQNSTLIFKLVDKAGNTYVFRLPNIVYTGGQPDTAAKGSIILTMPFMAIYDATSESQAMLDRIPVA